jgi:ComF family protein
MGKAEAVRLGLIARRIADGLIAVLLAPPCAACGEPLSSPTSGIVCDACWRAARTLAPPFFVPHLSASEAAGIYAGSLREIIHAFKYGRRTSLARPLAALVHERCPGPLDSADALVPVPLHRSRQHERGFNQAALIARALPVPCVDALIRVRSTPSQTDLPAEKRRSNVRGAFAVAEGAVLPPTIVLVDDVATTGATLSECARVLREAGAREVRAVAVARAL